MKKNVFLLILCFSLFGANCKKETGIDLLGTGNNPAPIIVEAEHFSFMLYNGQSQDILPQIQSKLDDNYSRVLSDLEVDAMNKVKVRIWNSEAHFLNDMQISAGIKYPGATGWVYNTYDIRILYQGSGSAQTVLHEFCHAVSLVVNPQFGNHPRWFWEAVAIYESGELVDPKGIIRLVNGNFPTIAELNSDYNAGNYYIYMVGYLLFEYILMNWGKSSYINLIKSNGNIHQTLGLTTQEFEEGWKTFVTEKYFE